MVHPKSHFRPLIGVSTNVRQLPDYKVHVASEMSLHAVYEAAGGLPLMLPALGDRYDFAQLVERLDGLLLTGGASHVAPLHYSGENELAPEEKDPERDATTLPLIRMALATELPILAICRGMQELNVVLGGTLQAVADKAIHSSDNQGMPLERWLVTHTHPVEVTPHARLAAYCGLTTTTLAVNSAHSQQIGRVAAGVIIEARSADGTIEAISVADHDKGPSGFALGVQWHPEYMYQTDPYARALFEAFGAATRQRYARRLLQRDWSQLDATDAAPVNANLGS